MGGIHYVNNTGCNDFKLLKVARDMNSFYLYAETAAPITPEEGSNWMNLFIRIDGSKAPAWAGFHYLVQPSKNEPGAPLLLRQYTGNGKDWQWGNLDPVPCYLEGNRLALRVSKWNLSLPSGSNAISFKWADNMQQNTPSE